MVNSNVCLKPVIRKTVIKGTILLVILTPFLEITPSKIINYLIFVAIWYALLSVYMVWKRSYTYCIDDYAITIKGLYRERKIEKSQISDCFISQGFLARYFNCGSIYVIVKGRVVILRDIPAPDAYYNVVCGEHARGA
jgi:hypothetical protein